jgi:hypothetical protein
MDTPGVVKSYHPQNQDFPGSEGKFIKGDPGLEKYDRPPCQNDPIGSRGNLQAPEEGRPLVKSEGMTVSKRTSKSKKQDSNYSLRSSHDSLSRGYSEHDQDQILDFYRSKDKPRGPQCGDYSFANANRSDSAIPTVLRDREFSSIIKNQNSEESSGILNKDDLNIYDYLHKRHKSHGGPPLSSHMKPGEYLQEGLSEFCNNKRVSVSSSFVMEHALYEHFHGNPVRNPILAQQSQNRALKDINPRCMEPPRVPLNKRRDLGVLDGMIPGPRSPMLVNYIADKSANLYIADQDFTGDSGTPNNKLPPPTATKRKKMDLDSIKDLDSLKNPTQNYVDNLYDLGLDKKLNLYD